MLSFMIIHSLWTPPIGSRRYECAQKVVEVNLIWICRCIGTIGMQSEGVFFY
jgi:hypothetical protein